jgi:hypothetical protein
MFTICEHYYFNMSIRLHTYTVKGKVTLRSSLACSLRRFAPTLHNSAVKLV